MLEKKRQFKTITGPGAVFRASGAALLILFSAGAPAVAAEYTVSEGAPAGDLMDLLQITTLLVVLLLLKWADGASGITFWRLPNHHLRREDRDCHGVDSFTLRAFREDMGHEDLDGVFREESEMS